MTKLTSITILISVLIISTSAVLIVFISQSNQKEPSDVSNSSSTVEEQPENTTNDVISLPILTLQESNSEVTFDVICEHLTIDSCELWSLTESGEDKKLRSSDTGLIESADKPNHKMARWSVNYDEISGYKELYLVGYDQSGNKSGESPRTPPPTKPNQN